MCPDKGCSYKSNISRALSFQIMKLFSVFIIPLLFHLTVGKKKWKNPKRLKYSIETLEIEWNQNWLGDDVFYPKALIKQLANEGRDVSKFRTTIGALPSKQGKGLVSLDLANSWRYEENNQLIIPYTFHDHFPFQNVTNATIVDMNRDLGCVQFRYVERLDTAAYENGVIFVFENITGWGCYSALGKEPGFIGMAQHPFNSITDFGVPAGWQLVSMGTLDKSMCDGTDPVTIKC